MKLQKRKYEYNSLISNKQSVLYNHDFILFSIKILSITLLFG